MPVVTRADCSTLEITGEFIFRHTYHPSNTNTMIALGPLIINTVECDGINGQTNDLQMYYEKLYTKGKINLSQKDLFDKTVVGDSCDAVRQEVLSRFLPTMEPTADPTTVSLDFLSETPTLEPTAPVTNANTKEAASFIDTPLSSKPTVQIAAPSNSESFVAPSSIVSPSISPSSSPSMSSAPTPVSHEIGYLICSLRLCTFLKNVIVSSSVVQSPDIVLIGNGKCLSSTNRTFDHYLLDGGIIKRSPEYCAQRCLKHEGFVGFWIEGGRWCHCYYEEGFFPQGGCPSDGWWCDYEVGDNFPQGGCPSDYWWGCWSQFYGPQHDGIGEVTYSDGSLGECYKYRGDLFEMPTTRSSVRSEPSYHPNVSAQPSISSQHSAQPSISPSS
jgi:hypothetical protein